MFRWKTLSLGIACTASLTSAGVFAACPCNRTNVMPISQIAPPPGAPLTPIPMTPPSDGPTPNYSSGLPPAPPPGLPSTPPTTAPQPGVTNTPQPTFDPTIPALPPGQTLTPTPIVGDYAPLPPGALTNGSAGVNRFGMSPPPGTLGRTYQQRSRIFDDEKHPRMAAVDVYLPEELDVSARGMKSIWTGKHWRLEAKDPLLPGVPHIYAIKAERKSPDGQVVSTDVRWIRLIPGRVVDLRF